MPNFLDENGLQQLKTNLDNLYARRAAITAGTAGSTTDTSGSSITIPYVTMNDAGIVTGYGTKTHTGILASVPSITYAQESSYYDYDRRTQYRHRITVTRNASSGRTSYWGSFSGSFTGSSTTLYTGYTSYIAGNTVSWSLYAFTEGSLIAYNSATTSATSCGCSCNCNCGCDCSCSGT